MTCRFLTSSKRRRARIFRHVLSLFQRRRWESRCTPRRTATPTTFGPLRGKLVRTLLASNGNSPPHSAGPSRNYQWREQECASLVACDALSLSLGLLDPGYEDITHATTRRQPSTLESSATPTGETQRFRVKTGLQK
jgi:hypothetical protein